MLQKAMKNPQMRCFAEMLSSRNATLLKMDSCKRCGRQVCHFLAVLFSDFLSNFKAADDAPDTKLTHIFYKGEWFPAQFRTPEPSSRLQPSKVSTWCNVVFYGVAFSVLADLKKCEQSHAMAGGTESRSTCAS